MYGIRKKEKEVLMICSNLIGVLLVLLIGDVVLGILLAGLEVLGI